MTKMEYIRLSNKDSDPEGCEEYKYLGSITSSKGATGREKMSTIRSSKLSFNNRKNFIRYRIEKL